MLTLTSHVLFSTLPPFLVTATCLARVCYALNESVPHGIMCLNTRFPAGGMVWGGCGTFRSWVQLEEVSCSGQANPASSTLPEVRQPVASRFCFCCHTFHIVTDCSPSNHTPPPNCSFLKIFLSGVFLFHLE